MTDDLPPRAAPLFDRTPNGRSFVPTELRQAGARSGGPGRPSGRRGSALPWTGASTAARLTFFGTLALVSAMICPEGGVHAQAISADRAATIAEMVTEAAQRFGMPERWITAVMRVESAFDARATSPAGAMGLMQVMPQTYASLRLRYGLGADPYHPRDNILAGTAYLREMYDRFGAAGFLAAYNAGPGRYQEHLNAGRPLPLETRDYVAKLAPKIGAKAARLIEIRAASSPRPTLFVPIGDHTGDRRTAPDLQSERSSTGAASPLFAALTPREATR